MKSDKSLRSLQAHGQVLVLWAASLAAIPPSGHTGAHTSLPSITKTGATSSGIGFFAGSERLALDDVKVWAGNGTSRAAFVIHWSPPEFRNNSTVESPIADCSLAWGFRWDGAANAQDMLEAICAADPRLFVLASAPGGLGRAVFGFGFDLNENGINGARLGTNVFNRPAGGLLETNTSGVDALQSLDAGDLFWSGWFGPGWEFWIGATGTTAPERGPERYWTPDDPAAPYSGTDGQWSYAQTSLAGAELTDGSWIGVSVAAGGFDFLNPTAPGTIAYHLRKHAPESPAPASTPLDAYATAITGARGPFGASPYDDPTSLLGMPATDFYDPSGQFSGGDNPRFVKLVEPAYNLGTNQTTKLFTTLSSDGDDSFIIAGFAQPIRDEAAHPYGIDFLVFGNAFYVSGGAAVSDEANMNDVSISGGGFFEPLKVSVSPGFTGLAGEVEHDPATWPWYQYADGPYADAAFPTHAYRWDRVNTNWSAERMDFTKPVNPALNDVFNGISAADAIDYYTGSGGGTGFDLAESGFEVVRYVKVEGIAPDFAEGEVDAFAVVRPATLNDELSIAPGNLANGTGTVRFQRPGTPSQPAAVVTFTSLAGIARVRASAVNNSDERAGLPDGVLGATRIGVSAALGTEPPQFTADVALSPGPGYVGDGGDLRLFQRQGTTWTGQGFTFEASTGNLVVSGLAADATFAVVQTPVVPLAIIKDVGVTLAFDTVSGWLHFVERTTDFETWTPVERFEAASNETVTVRDPQAPGNQGYYRVRLELP